MKERHSLDGAVLEYLINKSLFTAGTPYFFKVGGPAVGSCWGTKTTVSMSSCQLSQMAPFALEVGETRNLTVQTTDDKVSRTNISRVEFSSEPAGVVSLNPAVDSTRPTYSTTVKGVSDGRTTVTAKVYSPYDWMTTEPICSGSVAVTVGEAPVATDAWWQVKDGNVFSASSVRSRIPATCSGGCLPCLITGETGLLALNGTAGLGAGTINQSGKEWQAQTVYRGAKIFLTLSTAS